MNALKSIVMLILGALLIGAAGFRGNELLAMRREHHLTQADPLENAPPMVAFTTVAFGGFRGLIADLLWLRAAGLQEEGNYFELVQLSDWITKLEPRFTAVWAYHAWNLAYNISVLFSEPADRWRWVSNGMKLLRDEGLTYNPGDARLLYELGWIFQHKMGTDVDQAHMYYKRTWASEMDALFHGPSPDFAALAADTHSATAKRLRDEYKMDPAMMEQVDRLYGPLDWRLPQAHAIFWAWQSKQVAEGFDAMAANRMIFQSLADAFRRGRLFVSKDGSRFIPSPNIDLIPRVDEVFQATLREHPGDESIMTAHAHFLRESVVVLFTYNRIDQARALYDDACARYPSDANGKSFGDFVLRSTGLNSPALTDRDAAAIVEGLLYQSVYWQVLGDSDRAEGTGQWAVHAWNVYMSTRQDPELKERVGLPPLEDMRRIAAERVRTDLGM
ncbi:MAG: hypothetical protein V1929_11375 [bacterium]